MAMPATCVPCVQAGPMLPPLNGLQLMAEPAPICCSWPLGHSETELAQDTVLLKHASATALPSSIGCAVSKPVSRMATLWPAPV